MKRKKMNWKLLKKFDRTKHSRACARFIFRNLFQFNSLNSTHGERLRRAPTAKKYEN